MNTIEQIKEDVKGYLIEPVDANGISVHTTTNSKGDVSPIINVNGRVLPKDKVGELVSTLGFKDKIKSRIIGKRGEALFNDLKEAVSNTDILQDLSVIVADNKAETIVSFTTSKVREQRALDYSMRIDAVMEAIEESNHKFHNARFNRNNATVTINTCDESMDVKALEKDMWHTGTSVNLGLNAQQFDAFYLRLICTNGMTTKEKTQTRKASADNIGNQLLSFINNNDFNGTLSERCAKLTGHMASVDEMMSIVNGMSDEQIMKYVPEFIHVDNTYKKYGYDIQKMSGKQRKVSFTDQNLYDVFNKGTNLCTHHREALGDRQCLNINKACSDIFIRGPQLNFRTLNPFAVQNN